jgi:Ca-activated chloride channel family protein
MFRFASPFYFFLLLLVIVAGWFVYRRRHRQGVLYSVTHRLAPLAATWRTRAAAVLPALTLAGLALLTVALARPQTVLSRSRRTSDAVAVHMVVDMSGSMEALDLSIKTPAGTRYRTRLDAVKETFAEFIAQRPDDLIGLVTFGGFATTRVPLTMDHRALQHVLEGVEIPSPSRDRSGRVINQEELLTAIGDALATACARLEDAQPTSRIIVLLSDGESNTGIIPPEKASEVAEKLGIKVYTIGVGSTGRAPFKARDMSGRETIHYAHVKLDEVLLKSIADKTGGRYFNVRDPKGLTRAMEAINELETTEVEQDVYYQFNELFPWFLFPAMCLVAMGIGVNMLVTRRVM